MMPTHEGINATNAMEVEMKNTLPGFHFATAAINVEIKTIEAMIQNVSCTGSTIGQSMLFAITPSIAAKIKFLKVLTVDPPFGVHRIDGV